MNCKEIMTPDPKTCKASASAQEAAQLMEKENVGILPVTDDRTGRLVGVLTDRDLCLGVIAKGRNPKEAKVSDFMSRSIFTCGPDDDLQKAEDLMKKQQIRRIPVLDADGLCVGIISQGDLALKLEQPVEVYETVRAISRRAARVKAA